MTARRRMVSAKARSSWPLQDAKARFSEVVDRALAEGPQRVTRRGREAVVVVAADTFEAMHARWNQPASLVDFFQRSPLAGVELDLRRAPDLGRDIDL